MNNSKLHSIYLCYSDSIQKVNEPTARHRIALDELDELVELFRNKEGIRKFTDAEKRTIVPAIEFFDNVESYLNITKSMTSDEIAQNMSHWSGLLMVDFDLNHYQGANRQTIISKIDEIESNMVARIVEEGHFNNFAFVQKSLSNVSMHFVFYFDTEKTIKEYTRCYDYAYGVVRSAAQYVFGSLWDEIADDVKNAKWQIWDRCSASPAQRMCISPNPIKWNPTYILNAWSFGAMDRVPEYKVQTNGQTITNQIINPDNEPLDYIVNVKQKNTITFKPNIIPTFHHDHIWQMAGVMLLVINDKDKCIELFRSVAHDVAKQYHRTISAKDMRAKFIGGLRPFTITPSTHKDVIRFIDEVFGIEIKTKPTFNPNTSANTRKYDEIITLNEGETIADYITQIIENKEHNLIYIDAGCGYGKTYSAKAYARHQQPINAPLWGDIIEKPTNKRICFVTPLQSINRDSFEEEKGWAIIDGDHSKNRVLINDSSVNICTTWDTFCARKMYERRDFDVFIIDESHLLFLVDYRFTTICKMMGALNYLMANNRKTILYSGTPSTDFTLNNNAHKIKFTKSIPTIKANLIFYANAWMQNVAKDVIGWLNEDEENRAIIMYDYANEANKTKLSALGVRIDTMYNKSFKDDVKSVQATKHINGRVCFMSTFASVGVNIYPAGNERYKLFIINENACAIIQYANRLRVRGAIDGINVYVRRSSISNGVRPLSDFALERAEYDKQVRTMNVGDCAMDDVLRWWKDYPFIHNVDGRWCIDEREYEIYDTISQTIDFESQTQIVYNRLIDNGYEVEEEYRDEVEDVEIKTPKHFADAITALEWDDFLRNKETNKWFIPNELPINKHITNRDRAHIEYIRNNATDEEWEKFKEIMLNRKKPTITKTDVKRFANVVSLMIRLVGSYDVDVMGGIVGKNGTLTIEEKIYLTAVICGVRGVDDYKLIDCIYNDVVELCRMVEDFGWFIEERDRMREMAGESVVKMDGVDVLTIRNNGRRYNYEGCLVADIESMDDEKKAIYVKAYEWLDRAHRPKPKARKMVVVYRDGVEVGRFDGVSGCVEKLGVSEPTIKRRLKDGKPTKKGYTFQYVE